MKKQTITIIILSLFFLITARAAMAQEGVWFFFAVDKEDNVSLDSFNVWPEEYGGIWNEEVVQEDAFEVRVLDSGGNILNRAYFIPDFLILSDPPIEVEETITEIVFPYSQSIKIVQVWKAGRLILTESIGEQLCSRDGTCNNNENYLSCPSDCSQYSEDGFCNSISNDHICDPDCFWDSEVGGECSQPNCNDGIRNQDETGIDTGGICLELKCNNGIQDPGEEDIDCGGVCSQWWQCAQDFCGDNICAEYESETDCPKDCAEVPPEPPKSILKNTSQETLTGYLLMKVQKQVNSIWQDSQNVVRDTTTRTLQPDETLNLRDIWNSQNYTATTAGTYRIYTAFLDLQERHIITKTLNFSVASVQAPSDYQGIRGIINQVSDTFYRYYRIITQPSEGLLWR